MHRPVQFSIFLGAVTIFSCFSAYAGSGNPFKLPAREVGLMAARDTLPGNTKPAPEEANDKKESIIKEVPKSRKQVKPIAVPVTVTVKPIQVIKPIIKPIIRIKS